jgi:hypothetical protein
MTLPKWDDPTLKAGTMIRTALWLISEIGVGNSFTKEQHRMAFSGITQADRRLRDLRRFGWVIHTRAEDLTLNPEEQRFVTAGTSVWERGVSKTAANSIPTAKMRGATLAENDYQCVTCGIAGGERYPDAPHMTAVLAVARRTITVSDGSLQTMFVSECKRCHSGAARKSIDVPLLLANINSLDPADRAVFAQWAERGRRGALESLWSEFRRLPVAARDRVRALLNPDCRHIR